MNNDYPSGKVPFSYELVLRDKLDNSVIIFTSGSGQSAVVPIFDKMDMLQAEEKKQRKENNNVK